MPEKRLQKCRDAYPEMTCEHLWTYHAQSNIAPYIEANGDRTTVKLCLWCSLSIRYTRSQEQFEKELQLYFPIK